MSEWILSKWDKVLYTYLQLFCKLWLGVGFCKMAFSVKMSIWFLSLLWFMWYLILIYISCPSCIFEMKLTWSWCMIFLIICCVLFASILLRNFAFVYQGNCPVIVLDGVLVCFWCQGNPSFNKWIHQCFFPLPFHCGGRVCGVLSLVPSWCSYKIQ